MTRIFVIDDDSEIRDVLKDILARSGYEVMVAADGAEALTLQKATPADLIITDIIMPQKEGLETIMEYRRDFPSVKIIAMSGGGKVEPETYLEAANLLGAQAALSKPFGLAEMLATVKKLLAEV